MRFVAVKTEEQQARGMLFHTRDLLVRQRTQTINALRGHLAEFGIVAPQGVTHVGRLASALEDPRSGLLGPVRELGGLLLDRIADLDAKIDGLEREVRARARQAVVSWAVRRGETSDPWLARMLACKPRMLVAVALANRMARIVWALMTKKESYYRVPAAA